MFTPIVHKLKEKGGKKSKKKIEIRTTGTLHFRDSTF